MSVILKAVSFGVEYTNETMIFFGQTSFQTFSQGRIFPVFQLQLTVHLRLLLD